VQKLKIHLLGWLTLIVFPIPAFLILYYFEGWSFSDFIQLESFTTISVSYGIEVGIIYAFIALAFLQAPVFQELPTKQADLIRGMNLNFFDILFLSICAGVGEELLFRVGMQHYFGPFFTSIIFVAIHGYLNPMSWRKSLYGFVVLPLAFILGYGYEEFGLWFSISAHFSYDLLVLYFFIKEK